jgi:type I restriction enzyme, S subunit
MARDIMANGIPPDWKYDLLDKFAVRCSGHTPSKSYPEYWDGGIKWISLADSYRLDKGYVYETDNEISEAGIKNSSAEVHPAGTVFISRDAGVGKSGVMAVPMAVSQHFIAWKCDNSEKLNSWFLYNWLQLNKAEFERQAVGSTIKTIGLPYFKKLKIAVPPYQEQKKMAKILSTWDQAISTTEQLLANSQQQKKALMQQLLTGKKRLLDKNGVRFSGEWQQAILSDVILALDSGVSVNSIEQEVLASHFILKTSCVTNGLFNSIEKKKVVDDAEISRLKEPLLDDSILISRMNTPSLVGANAYIELAPKDTFLPDRLWQVKANKAKVLMRWLGFWFSSPETRVTLSDLASGTSGSMKNISKTSVLNIGISIPSLDEQQKIASVLTAADQKIETLQRKLDCLKQEKKALMQQLLTGKRRVNIEKKELHN